MVAAQAASRQKGDNCFHGRQLNACAWKGASPWCAPRPRAEGPSPAAYTRRSMEGRVVGANQKNTRPIEAEVGPGGPKCKCARDGAGLAILGIAEEGRCALGLGFAHSADGALWEWAWRGRRARARRRPRREKLADDAGWCSAAERALRKRPWSAACAWVTPTWLVRTRRDSTPATCAAPVLRRSRSTPAAID